MLHEQAKLLFIVNSLEFGGAEKHVVSLLNRLDPTVFHTSLSYLKPKTELLEGLDHDRVGGGIHCCAVQKKLDWTAIRALGQRIREENTDVIVCTNAYSLLYGSVARILSGRRPKLIEVFHTTTPGSLRASMQLALYRALFRSCDLLIYVSESQRAYWRPRLRRRKMDAVIHNGIDLAVFRNIYSARQNAALRASLGISCSDYLVGVCAAMRPEKAHLDLIKAVERLVVSGMPISCLFIGDGPERRLIEREIEARHLSNRIKITGFAQDVRQYVACCDVMAIVSRHETFSISALEAMAMGKPMIMSRIGGASEQISDGENGCLFEAGDIDGLVRSLHYLEDQERRLEMGRRAFETVNARFTAERMVEAYSRFFLWAAGLRRSDAGLAANA